MLMLRGPVKVDVLFPDEECEWDGPWRPGARTLRPRGVSRDPPAPGGDLRRQGAARAAAGSRAGGAQVTTCHLRVSALDRHTWVRRRQRECRRGSGRRSDFATAATRDRPGRQRTPPDCGDLAARLRGCRPEWHDTSELRTRPHDRARDPPTPTRPHGRAGRRRRHLPEPPARGSARPRVRCGRPANPPLKAEPRL